MESLSKGTLYSVLFAVYERRISKTCDLDLWPFGLKHSDACKNDLYAKFDGSRIESLLSQWRRSVAK